MAFARLAAQTERRNGLPSGGRPSPCHRVPRQGLPPTLYFRKTNLGSQVKSSQVKSNDLTCLNVIVECYWAVGTS